MADEQPRPKDIYDDAHEWRRGTDAQISSLRSDVSELKTGLGRVQAGQEYLANTINNAVQAFQQAAKPKETQWGVLISLLGLIVIIAGGFTTLTTQPIIKTQDVLIERIQGLENTDATVAKFMGSSETWRQKTELDMNRIWGHAQQAEIDHINMVNNTAYARGKQDAYEGRLDRLSGRLDKLGERTYEAKP